jgi:hypothetical protein
MADLPEETRPKVPEGPGHWARDGLTALGEHPREEAAMSEAKKVLIVSEDVPTAAWWSGILENAGFLTAWCVGPDASENCPALDGNRCEVRQWADVAVVDVTEEANTELYGGHPERMCRRLPDDGGTVWIKVEGDPRSRASLHHPSSAGVLVTAVRAVDRARRFEEVP